MAIRIFFPSKYGKLERTFFQKKSFVQVAAPFFISPPKKKSPLVLSRCCLVLLFAFWLCFDDVAGYGWWITRNMPLGVHWRKKGPKKQQGNFVGRYYWVLNNYRGLAFCVRVCIVLRCCSSCSRAACSDGTQRRRKESASAWAAGVLQTREERARDGDRRNWNQ